MKTEVNTNIEVDLTGNEKDLKQEPAFLISVGVLLLLLCAVYWRTLTFMVEQWFSPDYIYGFFVIPFSIFLLWDRREMLKKAQVQFCAWGLPIIFLGIAISWYSCYKYRYSVDSIAFVILLLGFVLLIGGWRIFRWAWPGVVFLFFMISLPEYFSIELRNHLQNICTRGSVYILQTFGVAATQLGNKIALPNGSELNVAGACSGIRTLMLFFTACTGAALYVQRHVAVKLIMIASAVPIAIFCNTIRITMTAFVHLLVNPEAGKTTHDLAGLVMMPMAIGLLWLELLLIEKLFITEKEEYSPLIGQAPGNRGPQVTDKKD